MFKVENADFIADKLASELLPNQEFREVAKNAEEAIHRRLAAEGSGEVGSAETGGRIVFDVDWPLLQISSNWYLCCADDGDGMSRSELERYTTTLAVIGANQNQTVRGNQGMGLKISGPTRHKKGVLIRSLKDGERTMVQVGWTGSEYSLIPVGQKGELVTSVPESHFPEFILQRGSGTVVTFLGSEDVCNTFKPEAATRGWLFKYLHQRFFRFSDDQVDLLVRVPSGDLEEWPRSETEAAARMRGEGRSFNLSKVKGTASVWDDASGKLGDENRGVVTLAGSRSTAGMGARIHWWVLPASGSGSDVSSRTASGGSLAVLYQNELHDWRQSSQASPFFARLGVLFGKNRIAFVIEPLGERVASDFARAHVLIDGKPFFESSAWLAWADQFRENVPDAITSIMAEEHARLREEDPQRARRIRDRLKDVMKLLRPRRFRLSPSSETTAAGSEVSGPEGGDGDMIETQTGEGVRRRGPNRRGIGTLLSQADEHGEPATEVFASMPIDVKWVTEEEAQSFSLVSDSGDGIRDRAAALVGEDGLSAGVLLMNREFRGYGAILAALNEFANPEGNEEKAGLIEDWVQEWVDQKMIEAIHGLRQLENGRTWLSTQYDSALSPPALTAAFMADRYATLNAVKRQASSLVPKRPDATRS
ncbi:MAG: hypothetical protein DHS20C15_11120 [Planctomycetota bacterium]|nr:MAG: hypothetical protein DHS20C15_11120 [Planctomycetota bacterium]